MNKQSADTAWTAEAQISAFAVNTADQMLDAGTADLLQTAFPLWEAVCRHIGDAPYCIVYEDEAVLVCCKRAGVPVQSASLRTPDLESMLRGYLADTVRLRPSDRRGVNKAGRAGQAAGNPPYLGLVHRLDQPVAGLLVFAKTKQAAAALSKQVQDGTMHKQYLAVVRGLPEAQGVLTDYLLKVKDGKSMSARVVPPQTPGAKRAALDYEVLSVMNGKAGGAYALLRITLHTGRFHQIRAQLAHAGCPIVGDGKYGGAAAQNKTAVCAGGQADSARNAAADGGQARGGQLLLCAYRLAFTHPVTKKELKFSLDGQGGTQ